MPPSADEFAKRLNGQLGRHNAGLRAEPDATAPALADPLADARVAPRGDLAPMANPAFTRPANIEPASIDLPDGDPAASDEFSGRLADQLATNGSRETPAEEVDEAPPSAGPVGTGEYVVRPGDCISSIAIQHGHFWETLWNEPANAALREARQDPNTLLPGDRVTVPPLRQKREPGAAELRHRFRKKGQPETLRLRILEDDEPRANEPYVLDVDGDVTTGTTDPQGQVARSIRPDARRARLTVGEGGAATEYVFQLGELDPLSEISGVQARLDSLGFSCGPIDGKWGPLTRRAVEAFQAHHGLPVTGQPDESTRQKLREAYGC